ncbi:hypothetical protein [Caldalkalibacillus mannanilyticus]|uniref:hypothetical protein n=1 Tax=Caldalkalibacillus mannanilyticus TaxID=1418 RepID=UPI0004686F20|nr:hypothetical protein [Caldalkalibacillus mannanilyticus]
MKKNKVLVKTMTSEYGGIAHPIITVDDIPLDVFLHNLHPESLYLGLVPTIIDWIDIPKERGLVKSRFKSIKHTEILPILMCPDDCDLWCTVIVAEVINKENHVIWSRIGVDSSNREELIETYECIGRRVDWLNKVPSMTFSKKEYYRELDKIYNAIEGK